MMYLSKAIECIETGVNFNVTVNFGWLSICYFVDINLGDCQYESESHSVVPDSLWPHGYKVRGILQARVLAWVAFPFSAGSSQPRDWTQVSRIAGDSLPAEPQGKPKNTGVGSLSLLQEIFPTQELKQGLQHCRWILYQLSHQEAWLSV